MASFVELDKSNINGAGYGIFATKFIPKATYLGKYKGINLSEKKFNKKVKKGLIDPAYAFEVNSGDIHYIIDASDKSQANWTRYMNCSRNKKEENVIYNDKNGHITFFARLDIEPGQELLFYYGQNYANTLGIYYNGTT